MNCHIKPEETVLQVPGLARPVTLVQITDSHLTFADARASDYTRQMAVERTQCFARYPDAGTAQLLAGGLEMAASLDADCLVLTGDILDFPLNRCGAPAQRPGAVRPSLAVCHRQPRLEPRLD